MENTLENKAKFFAQYFGQEVAKCNTGPSNICHIQHYTLGMGNPQRFHLELRPLSSITDEELLAAIQILDSNNEFTELGSLQIGREIIQIVGDINVEVARNDIHPQYIFHFADFLRSKGYALPWMGLSLEKQIEYGWIKLKDIQS